MTGNNGPCVDLDGDSLERANDGDGQARSGLSLTPSVPESELCELFLELRAPLCRYLISLGLSGSEAEDVAQESFLRLCEKRQQKTENVRGWIFRVAHNLARDEHRRRQRRPTDSIEEGDFEGRQDVGGRLSPEESLLEREQSARLKSALGQLPDGQRQCLHLRAEGLRYREIAEVLGVGTSTVAEWVQKGLKQLEQELS